MPRDEMEGTDATKADRHWLSGHHPYVYGRTIRRADGRCLSRWKCDRRAATGCLCY